jgi:hypothetical protein
MGENFLSTALILKNHYPLKKLIYVKQLIALFMIRDVGK